MAQQQAYKKYSDKEIGEMYTTLRNTAEKHRTPVDAVKWNDAEYQVVSGYACKVAKASTLPEFVNFIRTGEPAKPIKMTAQEMELLQGGSQMTDVLTAIGALACAAGSACCT